MDPSININLDNGTKIIFKQFRASLDYYDTTSETFDEGQATELTFLSKVESNKSCFHQRKVKGKDEEIILQQLVGWPSTQTIKEDVQKNQTIIFPITTNDTNRAEAIYGTHIPIIQGKATISIPEHQNTTPRIPLYPIMGKNHHHV